MEVKQKIVLTESEINICKSIATAGVDEKKAEADAKGIPFDYEAEKAKREQEFILLYAEQKKKMQDWETLRDKAFHSVIGAIIPSTKLNNYVRNHVLDLKTFQEMDPSDILKVSGYGKKTADELREIQERIRRHPKILTRINKAIEAQRRLDRHLSEHRDTISAYIRMKSESRHTYNVVDSVWRYYGG